MLTERGADMGRLSAEQIAYIEAKAMFETVSEAMNAEAKMTEPALDAPQEELDAWFAIVEELDRKYGWEEARKRYHAAEQNLIAWGHSKIKCLPGYRHEQATIEQLFEVVKTKRLDLRTKVVDLIMRLQA